MTTKVSTPRTTSQRRQDSEARLAHDVDLWVATASVAGVPHLIPLSFDWNGDTILLATPAGSPTGTNLAASPNVRLALGDTRDVTIVEGSVETLTMDALPSDDADRFATRTGFDPRSQSSPYHWYRVIPVHIQSWREVNELTNRTLMRHGSWLE